MNVIKKVLEYNRKLIYVSSVDVRDVSKAIIECAKSDYTNKDYILSEKNYSIKEIDEYISLYTGGRKVFVYIPLWIMNMFYLICNFMYFVVGKKTPFTKVMIKKLKDNLSFSNLLAKKEIGYSNRDIRNTLFDILNFLDSINEEVDVKKKH